MMDVVRHFRLTHDPFKAGAERELTAGDGATLTAEDARRFIATRTAVAGRTDLFSPAALDVLVAASRGRPAALRLLAGNAMFHAAFDGAGRVEEAHARQAEATQDIWRDIPPPARGEPVTTIAAPPGAVAPVAVAPVVATPPPPTPVIAPAAAAPAAMTAAIVDDELPSPRRRGWWGSSPPLARLAIVVGLLLLSLPVIGYVVGAVKDDRPAAESSYPADGDLAAADAEAPIDTPPELPPAAAPAPAPIDVAEAEAEAGPPIDLTAQTVPPDAAAEPAPEPSIESAAEPSPEPPSEPVAVGAGETTPVDESPAPVDVAPAPQPEPAPEAGPAPQPDGAVPVPAADAPRVFVHYSTAQPSGAEAASMVARRLRAQGFEVVDIRAVQVSIETASVRYFFPDDRAAAEALHDALGQALRPRGYSAGDLKSMPGYEPPPRRGTLEVWVPAG